ncbi:hypothetical protein QYM36_007891 [Artemia franciscana]|uniref:RING-type E3 ubiquitin transferase n=1 Tax=Artemia franciscana TaxID=6661 RepID=A0AA88IH49_ARTSF|nr:hypothetical protein QYM36_007891 [Artemia franciscana]
MEYISQYSMELIALAVDAVLVGISCHYYLKARTTLDHIQTAIPLDLNTAKDIKNLVSSSPTSSIPYATFKGTVSAVHEPIRSHHSDLKGVIQLSALIEHRTSQLGSGLWVDRTQTLHSVSNSIPWSLKGTNATVEVTDSLLADILHLQTITDKFTPNNYSLGGALASWIAGERVKGIQESERMLLEGTPVTAYGEVVTKDEALILQPPSNGKPFILSTMSPLQLIRLFEQQQTRGKLLTIVTSSIGIAIIFYIAWKAVKKNREKNRLRQLHESVIRDRGSVETTREDQLCVVCLTNPKEVILLPCGHVCTCLDCGIRIRESCPVCRARVSDMSRAFIS